MNRTTHQQGWPTRPECLLAGLWILLVVSGLCAQPQPMPATAPAALQGERAAIVPFRGEVDHFSRDSLKRRFDQARQEGADTIIVVINTYGGLVDAGLDLSRFLKQQTEVRTIAFVEDKAISAGAMIALACDEIVMQPNALLGDCAPIAIGPTGVQELAPTERAKQESPILEDFYDSALQNGYDPLLVQSMVQLGRVVHWVEHTATGERKFVDAAGFAALDQDQWKPVAGVRDPIDGADTLLTVSTDLANTLGLSRGTYRSVEDFAQRRGLQLIAEIDQGRGERIVGWLSSAPVRALLTTLLMFAAYMAFSQPGQGAPEAVLVICLGLLLGVPALTGTAQWWEILAVLVGFSLVALEIFVIPGFGIPGITGIFLVLYGLVMAWVGTEPVEIPGVLPSLEGTYAALREAIVVLVLGLAVSLLLWAWLSRHLPKLPFFGRLILSPALDNSNSRTAPVPSAASSASWPAVGTVGRAITDLRPGGTAAFFDPELGIERQADVISDSGFAPAGQRLIVRENTGSGVIVRPVK